MDITFSRDLAKKFRSEKDMLRAYGKPMSKTLMKGLAFLEGAPDLGWAISQSLHRIHFLKGDRKGKFAMDMMQPHRLVFMPNHDPLPLKADGGFDLSKIIAIHITEVVDYH